MTNTSSFGFKEKVAIAVVSALITAALLGIANRISSRGLVPFLGGMDEKQTEELVESKLNDTLTYTDLQAGDLPVGANAGGDGKGKPFEVRFSRPFASKPLVLATAEGFPMPDGDTFAVTTFEVSAAAFKFYITRVNGTGWGQNELRVNWLAVEMRQPAGPPK